MSESSGADALRRRIPGMTSLEKLRILANNLLDRSEELRAENAAMRLIVEAVATNEYGGMAQDSEYDTWSCGFCDLNGKWSVGKIGVNVDYLKVEHSPTCPVTQARALLAKES